MADLKPNVETLLRKAATAEKSEDAMRFTQAALNAANTLNQLAYLAAVEDEAANTKAI
jgi:hypothetical protein